MNTLGTVSLPFELCSTFSTVILEDSYDAHRNTANAMALMAQKSPRVVVAWTGVRVPLPYVMKQTSKQVLGSGALS